MRRVELAYPFTDDTGKTYPPDSVVTVPGATASELIAQGRAREPKPAARRTATEKTEGE